MSHPLLTIQTIESSPDVYLRSTGEVFATFDERTQDSGNISFGVRLGDNRYFVKTAGRPDDHRPYLSHAQRVALLRNAVRVSESCSHPALARLRHVVGETPWGPVLVYDWIEGELLRKGGEGIDRLYELPWEAAARGLDAVVDAHRALAAAGYVAADFYDGCTLYDFRRAEMRLVDLDHYHAGPFTNEMGRMFGSTRFMAPEEFASGARIDERTTVFNLGRAISVLLARGSPDPAQFRGPLALHSVMARACRPAPQERFESVAALVSAWNAARRSTPA